MKQECPNFDQAVLNFQELLSSQQWPKEIRWIPIGGVLFWRGKMFVRVKSEKITRAEAIKIYNIGVKRNLGVTINGICHTSNITWAYISSPVNENASERLLYAEKGVKMSVSNDAGEVALINNAPQWFLLNMIGKKWGKAPGNKDY